MAINTKSQKQETHRISSYINVSTILSLQENSWVHNVQTDKKQSECHKGSERQTIHLKGNKTMATTHISSENTQLRIFTNCHQN